MHNLKKADVQLNRKMLSQMAIFEPEAFSSLVNFAKK
jgi:ribosomal protein L20